MSEDEVRDILELAAGPEHPTPGTGPDMAGLFAAARAARRRRRTLTLVAGAAAVAIVGGGTTAALSQLGGADAGTGSATTTAPTSPPPLTRGTPSQPPATTAPPGTTAPPPTYAPVWPPSNQPAPTGAPSNSFDAQSRETDRVMDVRANPALTYLAETLDPQGSHIRFQGFKRAAGPTTYEFYVFRANWQQDGGTGSLSVGFYAPGIPVGHHEGGSPERLAAVQPQCGELPARLEDDSFRWTECTTETLPDGTTLRLGKGSDSKSTAITATHTRADGGAVTVSLGTGTYERESNNTTTETPLANLPLTQSQLREAVLSPHLALAPAPTT